MTLIGKHSEFSKVFEWILLYSFNREYEPVRLSQSL